MNFGFYAPDWHTPTHILGSYFLTRLFALLPMEGLWQAAVIAFFCGCLWEVLDADFAGQWIWDPRGGDWGDILADALGCVLALFV